MIKQKPKIIIPLAPGNKIHVTDKDTLKKDAHKSRRFVATVLREYKDFWLVQHDSGYRECIDKRLIETGNIRIQAEG